MQRVYAAVLITSFLMLCWHIFGRWDPTRLISLNGKGKPSAEVTLKEDGKGQLTYLAAGVPDTVDVSFGPQRGAASLPFYELKVLSNGRSLRANMVFKLIAGQGGPELVTCIDCAILGKNALPTVWEIARE